MELKGTNHIYECYPPIYGNEDQTVKVKLKCVPKPDYDAQVMIESTLGMEARRKSGREFVAKYFCGVDGLVVDGQEIKTLEDIYNKVPGGELYNWIFAAVMSLEILTKAEVKN
jgi:hypothetical protein